MDLPTALANVVEFRDLDAADDQIVGQDEVSQVLEGEDVLDIQKRDAPQEPRFRIDHGKIQGISAVLAPPCPAETDFFRFTSTGTGKIP